MQRKNLSRRKVGNGGLPVSLIFLEQCHAEIVISIELEAQSRHRGPCSVVATHPGLHCILLRGVERTPPWWAMLLNFV